MKIFKKEEQTIIPREYFIAGFKGVEVVLKNKSVVRFNDANDYRIEDEGIYIYIDEDNTGFVKSEDFSAIKIVGGKK